MSGKMQSILVAGLASGVLAMLIGIAQIPFVSSCLGCLLYAAAGTFAVWHFTNTNAVTISGGAGAGMGALAGLVAALVASILSVVLFADTMSEGFDMALEQMANNPDMDADTYDMIEGIMTSSTVYIIVIVVGGLIGTILGVIGGAIGASVFKKGGEGVA